MYRIAFCTVRILIPVILFALLDTAPVQADAPTLPPPVAADFLVQPVSRDGIVSPQMVRLSDIAPGVPKVLVIWASWANRLAAGSIQTAQRLASFRRGKVKVVLGVYNPLKKEQLPPEISKALKAANSDTEVVVFDAALNARNSAFNAIPEFFAFTATGAVSGKLTGFDDRTEIQLDHLIEGAVRGEVGFSPFVTNPGDPIPGTVGASQCSIELLDALSKGAYTFHDLARAWALSKGGGEYTLLPGEADPKRVAVIRERFSWVNTANWDLQVADPQRGPWLKEITLREGDIILGLEIQGAPVALMTQFYRWKDRFANFLGFILGDQGLISPAPVDLAAVSSSAPKGFLLSPNLMILRPVPSRACALPQ